MSVVLRLKNRRVTCPESRVANLAEESLNACHSVSWGICPKDTCFQAAPTSSRHQVSHTRDPSLHLISYKGPLGSSPVGLGIGQGMCFMTWPPGGHLGMLFPMENLHLGWTRLPSGSPLLLVHFFKHLVVTRRGILGGGRNKLERAFNTAFLLSKSRALTASVLLSKQTGIRLLQLSC